LNRIDLDGRIAVVTGAARGIGRAIARRFSASGAKLAIWDVDGAAAAATSASVENATYARTELPARPCLQNQQPAWRWWCGSHTPEQIGKMAREVRGLAPQRALFLGRSIDGKC
jgi:NAD(P)-dependent dehydrogenase (short-subunit alcohol dehydrogenase family)